MTIVLLVELSWFVDLMYIYPVTVDVGCDDIIGGISSVDDRDV